MTQSYRIFCADSWRQPRVRAPPRLVHGTAVIVEGVRSKPEWNGRRGLVQSFDYQRGRYALLVEGRSRPLSVPPGCCRLESVVEQGRQLREAARRAEIEARVRAALDARAAAADAEAEPEPASSSHA